MKWIEICGVLTIFPILSFFSFPFLIIFLIQYTIARAVCHRPIVWPKRNAWILIIFMILSSVGCGAVMYCAAIGIKELLKLMSVDGLISANAATLGVVGLAIACSQWVFYKSVRAENFFSRFPIAREQRGKASIYPRFLGLTRWGGYSRYLTGT
jgi:hypothetical protein